MRHRVVMVVPSKLLVGLHVEVRGTILVVLFMFPVVVPQMAAVAWSRLAPVIRCMALAEVPLSWKLHQQMRPVVILLPGLVLDVEPKVALSWCKQARL